MFCDRIFGVNRKVVAPTANPSSGQVTTGTTVTLSCPTAGAIIYYGVAGIDESDVFTEYRAFTGPIAITENMRIRAYASKSGMIDSDAVVFTYNVIPVSTDSAITVSTVKGKPGDAVVVTLSTVKSSGFTSLGLRVDFDSERFEALSVQNLIGADLGLTKNIENGYIVLGWFGTEDYTQNSAIASITFKIKNTTTDGTYPISLKVDLSTTAHANGTPVVFEGRNGSIEVKSWILGDANGDGVIDLKDATLISRYYAGYADAKVAINLLAADGNKDGAVDLKDATLISRYYAGYKDAIDALKP